MIKVRVFDDNHLQLFYYITIQFLEKGNVLMNTKCFILICFGDTPEKRNIILLLKGKMGKEEYVVLILKKRIKLLYISRF